MMDVLRERMTQVERRMLELEKLTPLVHETHADVRVLSSEMANLSRSVDQLRIAIDREREERSEEIKEQRTTGLAERAALITAGGAVLAAFLLAVSQLFGGG